MSIASQVVITMFWIKNIQLKYEDFVNLVAKKIEALLDLYLNIKTALSHNYEKPYHK